MALTNKWTKNSESLAPPVYYVCFEDYLKPQNIKNKYPSKLLLSNQTVQKSQMRLKLLEHPVLMEGPKSKWKLFKENVQKVYKLITKIPLKLKRNHKQQDRSKISKIANIWQMKTFNKNHAKFKISNIQLPRFLAFLRARNDDGLCKRKSGFEIYCEMASIHGFINFVGASTWQRAFWFFVVLLAVAMSGFILLLSHLMNTSTPTILYSESTQYPTWSIPFPAVTICNLNRISQSKAEQLAMRFHKNSNLSLQQLTDSFKLALSTSENIDASAQEYQNLHEILKQNNYTLLQLLDDLTPNCEKELLRCKWQGHFVRCKNIFQNIHTTFGQCCAFNYRAFRKNYNKRTDYVHNDHVEYSTSCGYRTGLTVLLDPHLEDYKASLTLMPGFQILVHDAHDFPDATALKHIILTATSNKIYVWPQQTYSTSYIDGERLDTRKCYLPNERKLYHFGSYSQVNCLAECRSLKFYKKCGCALPNWPKRKYWRVCDLDDSQCYRKYKFLMGAEMKSDNFSDQLICDCYPLCDFNMYSTAKDAGRLTRKYSLTDERSFKGINITNHILLHVFFGELYAERLRLDVYENWLSFIGTFGGITGLHMGYSFVSGFELIFFVFVRPACNWLTKKQIRYRIKKRQRKAQLEAERKRKEDEAKKKQEPLEAL